jgi:uncharacterized protein (DUF1501 family)
MSLTRRDFMKSGISAGAAGIIVPTALAKGVFAATNDGTHNNRVLVVLQMGGGNDGLNTVVPLADPAYARLRPRLGLRPSSTLPLSGVSDFGLHPGLAQTQSAFARGEVAVVQGVGYPQPTYSHFQAMEVWQRADPARTGTDGWLGKLLAQQIPSAAQPLCSCALGQRTLPGELRTAPQTPVSVISSASNYQFPSPTMKTAATQSYVSTPGPFGLLLDDNLRTLTAGIDSLAGATYVPKVSYTAPGAAAPSTLASSFQLAAKVIATQPAAKIIHLSMGSFDTHFGQLDNQATLLADFDFAVNTFLADMKAQALDSRVSVMTWSEFGRRPGENNSLGTDHGSAGPVFLFGTPVLGGLAGQPCSLTDLDAGNLKFTTDFRSVYQSVIGDWLGGDPTAALGGSFPSLRLFR